MFRSFAGTPRTRLAALLASGAMAVAAHATGRIVAGPDGVKLVDGTAIVAETSNVVTRFDVIRLPGSSQAAAIWTEQLPDGATRTMYALQAHQEYERPRELSNTIRLRFASFDPAQSLPEIPAALAADGSSALRIVQFVTPIMESYRQALAEQGVQVVKFLPDNSYIVSVPAGADSTLRALPVVRWVGAFHPAYKLESALLNDVAGGGAGVPVRKYSLWLSDKGQAYSAPVAAEIAALGGTVDVQTSGSRMEATLNYEQFLKIIRHDRVLYVDRVGQRSHDMDVAREMGGANYIETVGGFTGAGVRAEVMDDAVRLTHNDFQLNPIIQHLPNGSDSGHGTNTTGIVFATGTANPQGRGMLPDAQPIFASYQLFTDRYAHTAELVDPLGPYRAVFQSNSWGDAQTPEYTSISAEMDELLFDHDIIILNSQSNLGTTSSRPQAWAKNIVSIGGICHFNTLDRSDDTWGCDFSAASIGPAEDGRIKPELANFYDDVFTTSNSSNTSYTTGFGGTSAATPITAGHFGLMFQMWAEGALGNDVGGGDVFDERPHMTTAKALMINTANPWPADQPTIARENQGYGSADLAALYDSVNTLYVVDEEDVLVQGQSTTYSFLVESGAPSFRVTMIYADPAGTPGAAVHRINDVSLKVTAPDNTTYYGNNGLLEANTSAAGGESNTVDTVENVFIDQPAEGFWTVEILADEVNQDGHVETPGLDVDYSLVVTGGTQIDPPIVVKVTSSPNGQLLPPGTEAGLTAEIRSGTETLDAASPQVFFRDAGGTYVSVALTNTDGDNWSATLPLVDCGDTPEFYVSASSTIGTVVTSPNSAPSIVFGFSVGEIITPYVDDLEIDLGWVAGAPDDTAIDGLWEYGDPIGTGAAPEDDHTVAGTNAWITDNSASGSANKRDVDQGKTTLFSPVIDLSGLPAGATMSYYRWYNNQSSSDPLLHNDVFRVDITNDGGANWVNVETVGPSGSETGGGWRFHEFVVDQLITPNSTVQLRFVAEDLSRDSLVEAGVDDLAVQYFNCTPVGSPCPGDIDGDDDIDLSDLGVLLAEFGCAGPTCEADVDNDDDVDLSDLGIVLAGFGVPCP